MTIHRNINDNSRPSAPPIELLGQIDHNNPNMPNSFGLNHDDIPNPHDLGPPPTYDEAMKQENQQDHDSIEHNNTNLPDDDDEDPDGSGRLFGEDSSNNSMSSLRDQNHHSAPPRSSSRNSSSHRDLSASVKHKKKGSKIKRGLEEFAFAIIQLLD